MWNTRKNCSDEIEEKTPVLKDGEKWKSFQKCLFDNNDKDPLHQKERYKYQ